jgi:rRNA maturation RNase YbeY
MNQEYLNHDTHTDIITFDYSSQKTLSAEIFISMWAIRQSAKDENQTTENETLRVISHGVLHCMGLNDKKREEKAMMRKSENRFIELFHVKQKKYV